MCVPAPWASGCPSPFRPWPPGAAIGGRRGIRRVRGLSRGAGLRSGSPHRRHPMGPGCQGRSGRSPAAYREELTSAALTVGALVLGTLGTGFGLWRARRARYEAALARSQARLSMLLDQANDAILFIAPMGRSSTPTGRRRSSTGTVARSSCCATFATCGPRRPVRASRSRWRRPPSRPGTSLRPCTGAGWRHVSGRGQQRLVELDRGRTFLSIVRDLSDRDLAQRRIETLNRLLRAVTEIDELLVRERT